MNERWPELEDIIKKLPGNPKFVLIQFEDFVLIWNKERDYFELLPFKEGDNHGSPKLTAG